MLSNCGNHAIKAFAEGATDYLMTPVIAEQFDLVMARARHRLSCTFLGSAHLAPDSPELVGSPPSLPRFLVGQRQRRLYPLDPKSIDYIEADGNYVTLRAGNMQYLSRDSIKRLSMRLAEFGFIRIERSLLVNAAAVLYAETAGHGTFALTLSCGVCLHSSAAYRESILRTIPLPALSKRNRDTVS
jgi:two-component system LytT family response regulator